VRRVVVTGLGLVTPVGTDVESSWSALLAGGHSLIVIEHNLDVIRRADYVVDLGPEGGPGGGELVACGAPDAVARCTRSHTGAALRGRI